MSNFKSDIPLFEDVLARKRWMGLLARAHDADFSVLWDKLGISPEYIVIKPEEQGLIMVRGRAGGSGRAFNLGEMTLTRCSVRLDNGIVGHSYVAGRRSGYAEKAALIDALMQDNDNGYRHILEENLLAKLEAFEHERRTKTAKKAASTKVDFFTLVRGEG